MGALTPINSFITGTEIFGDGHFYKHIYAQADISILFLMHILMND